MDNSQKKLLTPQPWDGISLSSDEKRIIYNLRVIVERSHYGSVIVEIHYHKDKIKNGQVLQDKPKL